MVRFSFQLWDQALSEFFVFFVTLSCYPSINGSIESMYLDNSRHQPWYSEYGHVGESLSTVTLLISHSMVSLGVSF